MKTYPERARNVDLKIQALKARKKRNRSIAVGAAAAVLVLILAVSLFLPGDQSAAKNPRLAAYSDSPYYELICTVHEYRSQPKADKTSGSDFMVDGAPNGAIPEEGPSSTSDTRYEEVTDNQVEGVIETDIIKRSDRYIYYLRDLELSVYSIAGKDSRLVSSYTIDPFSQLDTGENDAYCYDTGAEMFLSEDCTTVTVIVSGYEKNFGAFSALVNLDVTDPQKPVETGRMYLTGSYLSARMTDGDILLMSRYSIPSSVDYSVESTWLPRYGVAGEMQTVGADDIWFPETLENTDYTVICKVDGATLKALDCAAFLSYAEELYVSAENVFATRSYSETDDGGLQKTMTEITCLRYVGDSMTCLGSVSVEGSVKDQYSMDEYDGILRVVTSINNTVTASNDGQTVSASPVRNASLYCISLEDFSVIASVEKFAPAGEQAESVRFDGVYAYVCTAEVITLTDPVYFFDLSDLSSITYKDTGTIDGYSSSLVNFGDGYLLGIGYGGAWELKIEVYQEAAQGVRSICAYERESSFSEVYKSYLIDRENSLIGLSIWDWSENEPEYVLLHFDGYALHEVVQVQLPGKNLDEVRAVLIDGWLYLFGESFSVMSVF